jgi:predicted DNA-binding protein
MMNRVKKPKKDTVPFSMRIEKPMYDRLKAIADANERSVAFIVSKAIEHYTPIIESVREF